MLRMSGEHQGRFTLEHRQCQKEAADWPDVTVNLEPRIFQGTVVFLGKRSC